MRKQKWWYSVGLGIAIWGLSFIWPDFNRLLASPLLLGLVIGLWAAMLAYKADRNQPKHTRLPRPQPVSANYPPLRHAPPTRPLRPVSRSEHSRPTRPISRSIPQS